MLCYVKSLKRDCQPYRLTVFLATFTTLHPTLSDMLVEVKIQSEEGKCLLNEIHPSLKEGDVIKPTSFNRINNCVDFKWHGVDACLWLGVNCVPTKKRRYINK